MTEADTGLEWADIEARRVVWRAMANANYDEIHEMVSNALREAFTKGASSRDADIAAAELRGRIAGLREAAGIAGKCFGPKDEALSVGESCGYDLAMGRIEDAIYARADELDAGKP